MIRGGKNSEESSSASHFTTFLDASASEIERDHGDRPLEKGDHARIWRHADLSGVELFRGSYKNYQFARHFHRVPAIGVVDQGSMVSYLQRSNHVLGTGTVLLLNPGEIHAPAPADASGWSFRMFYLDDAFFENLSWSSIKPLRFRQPFVQDHELATSLIHLHRELERNGEELHLNSVLVSILSRLTQRYAESQTSTTEAKSDKTVVDMARQYLEANYHRNLSLAELASLSPYSASHFLRMFRDIVGLTPHAYLTQYRIERATSMLQSGTPLVDIADVLGFTDQSHFTKKFKRMFGVTPSQYAIKPVTCTT